MKRSYRDNKPRFHKHRLGKMLLPHNHLAGLFFTVNPNQESRAQREAQLYLSTLTTDLEAAHEAFLASSRASPTDGEGQDTPAGAGGNEAVDTVPAQPQPSASLSSLLAAELAACSAQDARGNRFNTAKRPRAGEDGVRDADGENGSEEGNNDEDGSRHPRRDAPQRRSEWFAPLETGCKGYLFLNVPTVNPKVTCSTCHAAPGFTAGATESGSDEKAAPTTGAADAMPPHTIVVNPLVSRITERIFNDLAANPRPIFRNCFRLMPAELTCCPTLPEMQAALRHLLALHFGAAAFDDAAAAADDHVDFAQPIPLPLWGATGQPRRSMHTVALQLTVKNNTNVEQKKSAIASALSAAIPANRFIVVAQPSSKTKCTVEATVCVFVAHATCAMGVQRRITERHGFNLHAVGEDAFVLSNAVHALPPKALNE